jgi:hypothetical protein
MHLDNAFGYCEPQASTTFLARDRIVGLLELLKKLGLIGSGDAGPGVTHRQVECPFSCPTRYDYFPNVGEFYGVTDEIDHDLRQAATVTAAYWQFSSHFDSERELLVGGEGLKRAADGLGNILKAIIGEFEYELASLDLR